MSTPIKDNMSTYPYVRDLRDWFAGQALIGMQARMAEKTYAGAVADIAAAKQISVSRAIAECCYNLADDMIEARKEKV